MRAFLQDILRTLDQAGERSCRLAALFNENALQYEPRIMNPIEPIVYVVDDDETVTRAVSRTLRGLGLRTATFTSARRFLDQYLHHTPGCLVLDIAMPGMSGLELQTVMRERRQQLPIIFLTGQCDVHTIVRAMKQGAVDFLTKPLNRDALVHAVQEALAQDRQARRVKEEVDDIQRRLGTLTAREYEVFEHVITGKLNKETAADLGAAEKTIKVHRGRVMDKLNVQSVAELVRLAERAGVQVVISSR